MKSNIIIANWKMNHSFDDVEPWITKFNQKIENSNLNSTEIIVCPPAILLDYFDEILLEEEFKILEKKGEDVEDLSQEDLEKMTSEIRKINLGAQNCSSHESGSFTGEISAKMISDSGCKYVIIGHSERRKCSNESDNIVKEKILISLKNKLIPILCIGEDLQIRDQKDHLNFIKTQLNNSIPKNQEIEDFIVAYEPIWSIGTGKTPTLEQISEAANFIQKELAGNIDFKIKNLRIIYGGSTNKENSREITSIKNVNGLLVGGSSLDVDEFASISLSVEES
jgi:triosephosphate isomerase